MVKENLKRGGGDNSRDSVEKRVESIQGKSSIDDFLNYLKKSKELKEKIYSGLSEEEKFKIIKIALEDFDKRIRVEALGLGVDNLLGEKRLKVIKAAIEDPEWQNRITALRMGVNILSGKERLKVIKAAIEDPEWQIRDEALWLSRDTLFGEERFEIIQIALRDKHLHIFKRAEQYFKDYYPEEYTKYIQEKKQKLQKSK